MDKKKFFSSIEHKWDNYVLLILKCLQQIRQTNKVLHVSPSNHILSDLHLTGVNAKKLLTSTTSQNHRLRLPITKQTLNKNLVHVMNELTDAKFLSSKIKRNGKRFLWKR